MSPPASEIIETSLMEPEDTTNDIETEPIRIMRHYQIWKKVATKHLTIMT